MHTHTDTLNCTYRQWLSLDHNNQMCCCIPRYFSLLSLYKGNLTEFAFGNFAPPTQGHRFLVRSSRTLGTVSPYPCLYSAFSQSLSWFSQLFFPPDKHTSTQPSTWRKKMPTWTLYVLLALNCIRSPLHYVLCHPQLESWPQLTQLKVLQMIWVCVNSHNGIIRDFHFRLESFMCWLMSVRLIPPVRFAAGVTGPCRSCVVHTNMNRQLND